MTDERRAELMTLLHAGISRFGDPETAAALGSLLAEVDRLTKESGMGAFHAIQSENRFLLRENERLARMLANARAALTRIAKPALGGKVQQQIAREALDQMK